MTRPVQVGFGQGQLSALAKPLPYEAVDLRPAISSQISDSVRPRRPADEQTGRAVAEATHASTAHRASGRSFEFTISKSGGQIAQMHNRTERSGKSFPEMGNMLHPGEVLLGKRQARWIPRKNGSLA